MQSQENQPSTTELFTQFSSYNWDLDTDFQTGLSSILQSIPDPDNDSQKEELILRAKAFFYQKKFGQVIDTEHFKQWTKQQSTTDTVTTSSSSSNEPNTATTEEETPFPSSYARIVELILSGKPIPGIRDIPDTLLGTEAASKPSAQSRRKPWEIAKESVQTESKEETSSQHDKKDDEEVEQKTENIEHTNQNTEN